ncbi:uncharacterized protein LOC120425666 [Culex pipiens pallens]|uniref:uncharacterized protein LOC120425666 n=1 Tax=Culex pipiens pallens TaxID=42434 RepID=UPI001954547D|nr:uncharacterized protein LOC120425666 [Culex pipiens pallens]
MNFRSQSGGQKMSCSIRHSHAAPSNHGIDQQQQLAVWNYIHRRNNIRIRRLDCLKAEEEVACEEPTAVGSKMAQLVHFLYENDRNPEEDFQKMLILFRSLYLHNCRK